MEIGFETRHKMKSLPLFILLALANMAHAQTSISLKIDHYAILVDNLEASATFYGGVLGLTETENKTKDPLIRWFALADGREIHLINRSKAGIQLTKSVHLAFAVNDLDSYMKYLDSKNVSYENWQGAPSTTNSRPDGIRQIYLRDPDGYWIEINDTKR